MTLEYRDPGTGGRDELMAAIERDDASGLQSAMVAAALNVDDWEWLQDRFVALLQHEDAGVRAIAATSLGHVARIHGRSDLSVVRPLLEQLMGQKETRSYAEDALEDIEMFVRSA